MTRLNKEFLNKFGINKNYKTKIFLYPIKPMITIRENINMVETNENITLNFACPGYSKNDLELEAEILENILYVAVKFSNTKHGRSFSIGTADKLNIEQIKAKCEHGLLTIVIPKKEQEIKIKKIIIE